MASIGIFCPICTETFKSSDGIRSTFCGHLFHTNCLKQWKKGSPNCPTCQSHIESHRIYLKVEDATMRKHIDILDLQSEVSRSLFGTLKTNLAECRQELFQVQKSLSASEEQNKELIKKNEDLQLQNKISDTDIKLKTTKAFSSRSCCIALQAEIEVLNEKLEQTSLELGKQIRNSTELSIDKTKVEIMLEKATKYLLKSKEKSKNNNVLPKTTPGIEKVKYIPLRQAPDENGCVQSVVIRNVRGAFFDTTCVMNYIGKLMRLMNVNLTTRDVEQVLVLEGKSCESMYLIVKFQSTIAKVIFLSKSNTLKIHEDTRYLVLHEFVDKNTNTLFHQAKFLKNFGYKYVYCRNNSLFVKKDEKSIEIRIAKKEDIDKLQNATELKKSSLLESRRLGYRF